MTIDPAVLELATRTLTEKQFEAWILEAQGLTVTDMMFRLNIHKTTVKDRLAAAHLNLIRAGVRMDERTHTYYLEATT